MSLMTESFRQSGWQYEFYDDDRAAQFLQTHFPPAVIEAYDALLPGAFKADLFRYCVLLIMGGLYADTDVILESNLDKLIPPSVGFMTPEDIPGMTVGHAHCLWNGFLAAAPGHPFLAQTIQNVVNHIRNRYTSIDYDDMLCPNPVLTVSHLKDVLFTAGPCILGASVNDVLQLHRQTTFVPGDIEIFPRQSNHNGKEQPESGLHQHSFNETSSDPRLLIPGRSIILKRDFIDRFPHRFIWEEKNMVAAVTNIPDYNDRPETLAHYGKLHDDFGIYGLNGLYKDTNRANEEIMIEIVP
ncbi:hypothetical protein FisN_20Hu028 [Fistulifera solaris]|uniref:Alpha 1,4-glycosyltransferase domain-containing protein n=1 Tax=Fistulifera solaris TaxID=1519565 RepID=A0A1Z5KCA1_FISSO|nr:hypothetical protein FisN_20Hu028 [Fistulifera solaris]|eukprot:GAX23826.1 hypothetical protein FisN_20Hu028 [Fistulifera solaris]